MDAEQLVVNKSREGEVVEDVGAVLPHVHRPVLAQTLIVEPIHLDACQVSVVWYGMVWHGLLQQTSMAFRTYSLNLNPICIFSLIGENSASDPVEMARYL